MNVEIVYWTGTGNTEKMADLIAQGAKSAGGEVSISHVNEANLEMVKNADVLVLGCPSMGDEELEDSEFRPFVDSIVSLISGKKVALFGSYGWGDGQWMREWVEQMRGYGASLIDEGLIINGSPEGEDEEKCKEWGKALIAA